MSVSYDPSNIFAKILRGEMPAIKVYEDAHALAFLDIMPRADGHALVIAKAEARNILDIAARDLAALAPALTQVARAQKTALNAQGITLQQFSEPAGGQEVFHIHFHLLPRWDGVPLRPHPAPMAEQAKLTEQAEAIRAAIEQA